MKKDDQLAYLEMIADLQRSLTLAIGERERLKAEVERLRKVLQDISECDRSVKQYEMARKALDEIGRGE